MVIKLLFAYILGLILPGYLTARLLRCKAVWPAAVPLSILLLFFGAFFLNSIGIRLTFSAVFAWEIGVLLLLSIMYWRQRSAVRENVAPNGATVISYPLIAGTILVSVVAGYASFMVPLCGADTLFRWEFLARQIVRYQSLGFYPPVTTADFQRYFYPDGFAPIVSISYWWIYAVIGKILPAAVMPLVLLQYFSLLGFAWHLGERLSSRFAGWLACGMLAASPLFFRAVMIGQETGLTALAMVGAIAAMVDAKGKDDNRAFVLAALFAGLGGLTREYGVALGGGALLILGWRKLGWRGMFIFAVVTLALLVPWHLRNWLRCGNPLYTHSLGIFPINPVYAALVDKFKVVFGLENFGTNEWKMLLTQLLQEAGLPLLIGMPMAFRQVRRHGWLSLSIALSIALWLLSIGYTNGGPVYSMRVLSPALVLASAMAAINLADLSKMAIQRQWFLSAFVTLFTLYGAFCGAIFPTQPSAIHSLANVREIIATRYVNPLADSQLLSQLPAAFPPGSRILADNPYAHSLLANNDSTYDLVPIWSPEVQFLFDPRISVVEQRKMLIDRRISGAIYDLQSVNTQFTFETSQFYKYDSSNWVVINEKDDTRLFARFFKQ
jgi:hypothetical protein